MKTSRRRWIYDNLLRKLTFILGISSLPLVTEKLRIQINRKMWSKSVFRKARGRGGGERTRELSQDGGRYEGLRCNFCQTGSDWGGTRWQQRSIQALTLHFLYVNTSCNRGNHGSATCRISQLQLTYSAAMMAPYVKGLHLPGAIKNTVFCYMITSPQTKIYQCLG
jgi:hypothetical protein